MAESAAKAALREGITREKTDRLAALIGERASEMAVAAQLAVPSRPPKLCLITTDIIESAARAVFGMGRYVQIEPSLWKQCRGLIECRG